jgi:hypothetical protein
MEVGNGNGADGWLEARRVARRFFRDRDEGLIISRRRSHDHDYPPGDFRTVYCLKRYTYVPLGMLIRDAGIRFANPSHASV